MDKGSLGRTSGKVKSCSLHKEQQECLEHCLEVNDEPD